MKTQVILQDTKDAISQYKKQIYTYDSQLLPSKLNSISEFIVFEIKLPVYPLPTKSVSDLSLKFKYSNLSREIRFKFAPSFPYFISE